VANAVEVIISGNAEQLRRAVQQSIGGVQELGQKATQAGAVSAKAFDTTEKSAMGLRRSLVYMASAISGAGAVASIFARNNETLKRQLEVLSLTMSGLSTTIYAVGAAMRAVILIIGVKIAIVGAAIGAIVLLIRNWDYAKTMAVRIWGSIAAFFRNVFTNIALLGRGLGEILLGALTFNADRIRAGWGVLVSGLTGLKNIAIDLGHSIVALGADLWGRLQGFFGTTATAARGTAAAIKELKDEIDPGLVAALTWLGKQWEGTASEAERAAGRMGRSTAATAAAAQAVLDAYRVFTTLGAAGELRENRPGGEMREQRPERDALELARAINDQVRQRFEVGQATTEELQRANEELIKALEAYAAIATGAEKVRLETEIWRLKLGQIAKEAGEVLSTPFTEAARTIEAAFSTLFTNILTFAKGPGEALLDFFRSVATSIIKIVADAAAKAIVEAIGVKKMIESLFSEGGLFSGKGGGGGFIGLLLGALIPFLFAKGGISPGPLTPIAAAANGLLVNRPTLAMVGEGGQQEAVIPMPGGKVPVEMRGASGVNLYLTVQAWDTVTGMEQLYKHADFLGDLLSGRLRANHAGLRRMRRG
jgi:hypothetical protein